MEKTGTQLLALYPLDAWQLSYELCQVPPAGLEDFIKNNSLDGFNVTIPYKQEVIPYCSELSRGPLPSRSVNTMLKNPDGSYFGENTG